MPDDADVLGTLVRACADPDVAVAGPMLVGSDGPRSDGTMASFTGCAHGSRTARARRTGASATTAPTSPGCPGACMMIDRGAFAAAGGFDERYFLYKEEEDLCLRIRRAGQRVRYEPSVRVSHVGSVVAERRPEHFRPSIDHYLRKNFPRRWRRRALRVLYLGWARRG